MNQISARVDALSEGLATEARVRDEAVQNLESQCTQTCEDRDQCLQEIAPTASTLELEGQLKSLLVEVREEAQFGRREEAQRHQEAELSLRRLRSELDSLRGDVSRKEERGPAAVQVVMQPQMPRPMQEVRQNVRTSSAPAKPRPVRTAALTPAAPPLFSTMTMPVQPSASTPSLLSTQRMPMPSPNGTPHERWIPSPVASYRPASPLGPGERTSTTPLLMSTLTMPAQSLISTHADAAVLRPSLNATPRERWSNSPVPSYRPASPAGPGRHMAREVPIVVEATSAPFQPRSLTIEAPGFGLALCKCGASFASDAFHCHKCGAPRLSQLEAPTVPLHP